MQIPRPKCSVDSVYWTYTGSMKRGINEECEESAYTDSADLTDSVADFGFLVYKDFGTTV